MLLLLHLPAFPNILVFLFDAKSHLAKISKIFGWRFEGKNDILIWRLRDVSQGTSNHLIPH